MKMQGLSFDKMPAVHIPFRFFNTAPWMGVLAASILIAGGSASLDSQWMPSTLAVTHLLTLGFMAMIMLGALFQLLPVISGAQIPYTSYIATIVHIALLIGIPFLVLGFFYKYYQLFWIAIPLLAIGFFIFLGAFGSLLVKKINGGDSVFTIRFAAISLLITIILGVYKAFSYMGYTLLIDIPDLTYLHLLWGLVGWVLLLVMGVSYQIIPMFHVTPSYPAKLAKAIPVCIFLSLLLLTFIQNIYVQGLLLIILCIAVNTYTLFSLFLLTKRKRKVTDITVNFWRLALSSVSLASIIVLVRYFYVGIFDADINLQILHISIGIIVIYGFACSVIMGMLQKIIPFLLYMHMQLQCKRDLKRLTTLPNMHQIISAKQSSWQFRLHITAYILLLISIFVPVFSYIAALVMALDFLWLGWCIAMATRKYRYVSKELLAAR